jgi:hypothetical protein
MLLLAIPPLIGNLLACASAEPVDSPAPAKSVPAADAAPAAAPRAESRPAPAPAKSAPTRSTSAGARALFM